MPDTLKQLEAAGLLPDLEKILADYVVDPTGATAQNFRSGIDTHGLKAPPIVQMVGQAQQGNLVKPLIFKEFTQLNSKLVAAQAAASKPTTAAPTTEGTAAPAAPKAPRAPRAPKPPADPNAPKAPRAPRSVAKALNFDEQRGPGSPHLAQFSIEEYPAPIEKWWKRTGSVVRTLHEHLVANPSTLEELIALAPSKNWKEDQVKKYYNYFATSQSMLLAGWVLKVDPETKKAQMVHVAPNFDFRTNQPIAG